MKVEYQEVNDYSSELFSEAMKIYVDSFPANERQSIQTIKERMDANKSRLYVGTNNNQVVCMALVWYFSESEFVLLDYMAVKENYRQHQIGSDFFKHLTNSIIPKDKTTIMEVEHPDFGDNAEERKKRVDFYLNNGAYIIDDFIYLLPPLDGTIPTKMILMICPSLNFIPLTHQKIGRAHV